MRTSSIRRAGSGLLALTLLVGLGACGDDEPGTENDGGTEATTGDGGATETTAAAGGEAGGGAGDAVITIEGFAFNELTVPAGTEVTVTNLDNAPHTVTADDGAFEVAVGRDESGSFTAPGEAGEYAFHCNVHPSMSGTLVVE